MLLKVSDGDGGWVLIDKVGQVHLVAKMYTVKSSNELLKLEGVTDALMLISRECFLKNEVVNVGILEFVKNELPRKAFFTNVAYVCEDNGDTLDKLTVVNKEGRRHVA